MAVIFPAEKEASHYEQDIDLDAVSYRFRFNWNERESAWYFDLLDDSLVELQTGIKVVVGWPLLRKGAKGPSGLLEAIDTSGRDVDAGFAELGSRVKIMYTPASELA